MSYAIVIMNAKLRKLAFAGTLGASMVFGQTVTSTANNKTVEVNQSWIDELTAGAPWNTAQFRNSNQRHVPEHERNSAKGNGIAQWLHENKESLFQESHDFRSELSRSEQRLNNELSQKFLHLFEKDTATDKMPFNSNFVEFMLQHTDFVFPTYTTGALDFPPADGRYIARGNEVNSRMITYRESSRTVVHEWLHNKFLGESLTHLMEYLLGHEAWSCDDIERNTTFDKALMNLVGTEIFWTVAFSGNDEYAQLWDYVFNNSQNFKIVSHEDLQLARAAHHQIQSIHIDTPNAPNTRSSVAIGNLFEEILRLEGLRNQENLQNEIANAQNFVKRISLELDAFTSQRPNRKQDFIDQNVGENLTQFDISEFNIERSIRNSLNSAVNHLSYLENLTQDSIEESQGMAISNFQEIITTLSNFARERGITPTCSVFNAGIERANYLMQNDPVINTRRLTPNQINSMRER